MYTQIYLQFRTCVVYHKLYWYQTFVFIFIWMNVIHTYIYWWYVWVLDYKPLAYFFPRSKAYCNLRWNIILVDDRLWKLACTCHMKYYLHCITGVRECCSTAF
jgi:hypothetical protein